MTDIEVEDFEIRLFGDLTVEHLLTNAAGTCKLLQGPEGFENLVCSAASVVMVGSITIRENRGNSGEVYRYLQKQGFSWNFWGLPNPGLGYYRKHLPHMVRMARDFGKLVFVNVAGATPLEYTILTEAVLEKGADAVEINLSCPNMIDGRQIICFHPELVSEILGEVERRVGKEARIAVKISLFFDPFTLRPIKEKTFQRLVQVLGQSKIVKVLTSANTFPVCLIRDDQWKEKIMLAGGRVGLGGIGGPVIKKANLKQIKRLKTLLPGVDIFAAGGVISGKGVRDYQLAGVDLVQVGTALLEEGPSVFSRLLSEFVDEME